MSRQWQLTCMFVLAAALSVASTNTADEWDDFHITIDPSSPTDKDTFDLRAFRWFPDSGYLGIDQSISVSGNQIDVGALVQDQHTRPDSVFLTVMTPGGAFFNDFGPLAAGTYQVNAEIWLTPWPATSGGYLYDEGNLQFTVTDVGMHETLPGDFNSDGTVDAADYVMRRKTDSGNSQGYTEWQENFGEGMGAGGGSAGPSPPRSRRARTSNAGVIDVCDSSLVCTAMPGRIESPINSLTRGMLHQSTDFETRSQRVSILIDAVAFQHIYGAPETHLRAPLVTRGHDSRRNAPVNEGN